MWNPLEVKQEQALNQACVVAWGRLAFYFSVTYLSVLCGYANNSTIDGRSLLTSVALAAMFLPFLSIYAMLFELAESSYFPEEYTGNSKWENLKPYLHSSGQYRRIGWTFLALIPAFFGSAFALLKLGSIPYYFFVIAPVVPLALGTFLFANKYRSFSEERGSGRQLWELPSFFWSMVAWFLLILIGLAYAYIQISGGGSGAVAEDPGRQFGLSFITFVVSVLVFLAALILGGRLAARKAIGNGAFLEYESPWIREPFVLIATLVLPFITGLVSAYRSAGIRFDWTWLLQGRYIFVGTTLLLVGLVLELLRYLGQYDKSPYARSLRRREEERGQEIAEGASARPLQAGDGERGSENRESSGLLIFFDEVASLVFQRVRLGDSTTLEDRFWKSVGRYTIILVAALSVVPLVYIPAGLLPFVNVLIVPFVLLLFAIPVIVIRQFDEMGFNKAPSFRIRRASVLIAVKTIGYLFLLVIMFMAFWRWQANPLYLERGRGNSVRVYSDQVLFGDVDVKLAGDILGARVSGEAARKLSVLGDYIKNEIDERETGEVARMVVGMVDALNFTSPQFRQANETIRNELPKNVSEGENVGAVLAEIQQRLDSKTADLFGEIEVDLVTLLLSSFMTILVGLLLSSILRHNRSTVSVIGVLVGVALQAGIAVITGVLYFGPDCSSTLYLADKFCRLVKLHGHGVYVGLSYVVFSLGLLGVAALDISRIEKVDNSEESASPQQQAGTVGSLS